MLIRQNDWWRFYFGWLDTVFAFTGFFSFFALSTAFPALPALTAFTGGASSTEVSPSPCGASSSTEVTGSPSSGIFVLLNFSLQRTLTDSCQLRERLIVEVARFDLSLSGGRRELGGIESKWSSERGWFDSVLVENPIEKRRSHLQMSCASQLSFPRNFLKILA